jgi:DNA-binding transcriptional LysR family regulator
MPLPAAAGMFPISKGVKAFATLRDIEVLRAVVAARKTTAAATQLGISQPAVSRAIAQLEERAGRRMFRREGGRLVPTADALTLYAETTPVFDALSRLDHFAWTSKAQEPLRVVAPPTLAHHFMHDIIARYLVEHADEAIALEVTTSNEVFASVADRKADIGIIGTPIVHPSLVSEPFRRSAAVCAMPAGHRLAAKATIAPADLDGEPFIAFARRHASRVIVDRLFVEAGVRPVIRCETATVASAAELVKAGLGLSLLNPFPVALRPDPELVFRPFLPVVPYETAFVFPAGGPPTAAARRLADFARANIASDAYSVAIP